MYLWRGFPMVAVQGTADAQDKNAKGRVIHLARSTKGTLCGLPPRAVVDTKAATGWPDCDACIELSRKA